MTLLQACSASVMIHQTLKAGAGVRSCAETEKTRVDATPVPSALKMTPAAPQSGFRARPGRGQRVGGNAYCAETGAMERR